MVGVALVTGASGALGRAIAERLGRDGYALALHHHNNGVHELEEALKRRGTEVVLVQGDIRDEADCTRMISEAQQALGPVDLLVNNAGLVKDHTITRMDVSEWDLVLDTNLKGAFLMCRASVGGMRERRRGRIVNISSIVGAMGNFGQVNYAASKAGLIGFTKALAREVARDRVTVNCICPGFMDTPMVRAVPEPVQQKLLGQIPLGRFGEPSAVGDAVAYLAGPGGDYVTGQVLHVNGGMYM
ncbi:MAG TPA: 3-oxoacyl-ACP reductase FabG [Myxococcaceae bacterium]|nr:3-oxoacyl-ACP reductase FabG [Myxococcaceae bacterium]